MKHLIQIAFLFVFLSLCAANAYSCSCVERNARQDFRKAKAVFVGQVTDITKGDYPATVKFKVDQQWKGAKRSEILASWRYEGLGSCASFLFEKGEKYLVYASGKKLSVTTACTRTKKFEYAEDELKKLDSFWFRFFADLFPL